MEFFYDYGYWGLFFASFLAATILPFSSEALLAVLLVNHYQEDYCLTIATTGNVLGGMTTYLLGYLIRWSWLEKYFKIKEQAILRIESKVRKYGSFAAFFCWLPLIGDVIAVACGVFRMNVLFVFLYMTLGKLLRYMVVIKSVTMLMTK